ncbi:MAG: hypothetical protein N3E49_02865 [Bacteroidia bacterium]|nr:hypothetical protein [Bacteroidia bacterium]
MYLKLWSLPAGEALFEGQSNWVQVETYPAYRIAEPELESASLQLREALGESLSKEVGKRSRVLKLLRAIMERHIEEIQSLNPTAIYIGSARGELEELSRAVERHLRGEKLSPLTSPETSMGTLSSMVARRLGIGGPAVTISQTCLSGLLALYEASLFIRAGEGETVLFGAVEAPLAPFFVEAMAALRLYTRAGVYPFTRPGNPERANTFALGEGVALGVVAKKRISPYRLIQIRSRTAKVSSHIAYTAVDQASLIDFLSEMGSAPDFVILHAPGTRQGDAAEWEAIARLWGEIPVLSIKSFIGHSLGAAPLLGLAAALYLMEQKRWYSSPWATLWPSIPPSKWEEAIVIGLGYGGVMGAIRIAHES